MKKVANLADRKEAMELLKQLYSFEDVNEDDNDGSATRESGAASTGGLAESPSNP